MCKGGGRGGDGKHSIYKQYIKRQNDFNPLKKRPFLCKRQENTPKLTDTAVASAVVVVVAECSGADRALPISSQDGEAF